MLDASRVAMAQVSELLGKAAGAVSQLVRVDGGFLMHIEVVELEQIPSSTSVHGSYDVVTDEGGNVISYQRIRRYLRSVTGEL